MEKIPAWVWIAVGLALVWLYMRKPAMLALSGGYSGTSQPGVLENQTTMNDLPGQLPPAAAPPPSAPRGATSGNTVGARFGRGHF